VNKPSDTLIEFIAPSRNVDELLISDGYSVRNVAQAEQRSTLRLPRSGTHDETLVAARKFYDGSGGGEAGHYALIFVEFRAAGSRWRTVGVKVRAEEASRIARDMAKGKASKPGRAEPARVGGKVIATDDSELRGAPIPGGSFLLYVRHRNRAEQYVRTRGVEVRKTEIPVVAGLLKQLAAAKDASS
jgi:hypothetical protein